LSASTAPKVAVVTGAGSGIGRATASALRERGTEVIGVDLVEPPAELRADEAVDWIQGDVALPETWDRVMAACGRAAGGSADCLVTCAATIVVAPFLETSSDDWRRLFDVNVIGVILGMQALLPPMLDRRAGAIVAVCSVNSFVVEDELSAYSTSKAALLHAIRSAAIEYAACGVRINAVCPGIIDTPLLQRHFDSLDDPAGARRAAERRSPIGRILRPDEVAEAICFLVGPTATAMSGAALTVDGGLTVTYDFDSAGRG
jgi:NAD(P)-dependent dehydrogenase (short-subunit alcohol dehydrogenase family)